MILNSLSGLEEEVLVLLKIKQVHLIQLDLEDMYQKLLQIHQQNKIFLGGLFLRQEDQQTIWEG